MYWNPAIYQIVNPASNSGKNYEVGLAYFMFVFTRALIFCYVVSIHIYIFFSRQLVDIWFASAYYVFETGKARAFPAGLKMKASAGNSASRATAICAGPYACERTDQGGCQGTVGFSKSIGNVIILCAFSKPQKVGTVLRLFRKHFIYLLTHTFKL